MEIFLDIMCIVHILLCIFILTAFTNKKAAIFNVYYLIPFYWFFTMLPCWMFYHFDNKFESYEDFFILKEIQKLRYRLDDFCFSSPFTMQGILIFGLISSSYALDLC